MPEPGSRDALILLAVASLLLAERAPAELKIPQKLSAEVVATALGDLSGATLRPLDCTAGERAAVLIFISTDCPVANSYAPEIGEIAKSYASKGVRLTLVHVDPSLAVEEAARHASNYGLARHASIVIDRGHRLVRAVGATVTPEAAVVNAAGEILYRGRIDDRYTGYGDRRAAPSERSLRNALDAVLAGKPVPQAPADPIGCVIES